MNTHLLALQLMAAQGLLGAFDTVYHHELTEALPQQPGARKELAIHAVRALFYSVLFIGLACFAWHGWWAIVLLAVFGIEIVLTLWDFVTEDQTRLLPATERITHTVLAINGGAFITLLALNTPAWFAQPTALVWQSHGWLSAFLVLCGIGVGLSGVRDALASRALAGIGHDAAPPVFDLPPSHVLVTGATGFVGGNVVAALLRGGHMVTVLTRSVKQAAWRFDGKVRCIAAMEELAADERIDVVINLAGARILGWRWSERRKAQLRASRVKLTERLVAWMANAKHKPKLLLNASAIGYYGIQQQGDATLLDETAPPQAIFMSQLCQEWEAAARKAELYGVQVACLRFGLVVGRQGALPMMLLPIKLGLGGPLGGGRQALSWIHVDDIVRGMAHLWRQQAEGASIGGGWNFTAPHSVSQGEFSRIAAGVAHRPAIMPTPGWPVRLMLGEQADLLLEGQAVVPQRLQASGFTFRYPAMREALASVM